MATRVDIRPEMLTWAITRAGFDLPKFEEKNPKVAAWIDGKVQPTVKQLESFSKKVFIPFGYLLLPEPPKEELPIPYFRSNGGDTDKIHINVFDTILNIRQRQEWLKDYLKDNEFKKLEFVGRFNENSSVADIVADIRKELGLDEQWASKFATWEEARKHLSNTIESIGIVMVFNGVVENNTHRPIPVDECRGFVLVDEFAPFMFVNNSDWKSAQMFTIIHELAHIWTGDSAGFDLKNFLPANDPIELLCDKVAAEFLVPRRSFLEMYSPKKGYKAIARNFKVSEIVVARRALDLGEISKGDFFKFYNEYSQREFKKKENQGSGGDFFATANWRVSLSFAAHVKNALNNGQLLYRDAYRLTNLKGDTFSKFLSTQL
jgi:Zn-dependent peptidase ImmA (M78 family)